VEACEGERRKAQTRPRAHDDVGNVTQEEEEEEGVAHGRPSGQQIVQLVDAVGGQPGCALNDGN
jgi:hypothetical protein